MLQDLRTVIVWGQPHVRHLALPFDDRTLCGDGQPHASPPSPTDRMWDCRHCAAEAVQFNANHAMTVATNATGR